MTKQRKKAPKVQEGVNKNPEPLSLSLFARICDNDLLPPQPFIFYKEYFPLPYKLLLFIIYNVFW